VTKKTNYSTIERHFTRRRMLRNIVDFLKFAARTENGIRFFGNRGIEKEIPYNVLWEESKLVAQNLLKNGLKKGQRVAIVLPTCEDFIKAFFGTLLAGGVPSCLYPPVRLAKVDEWKEQTAYQLMKLEAQIILTDHILFGVLGEPASMAQIPKGIKTVKSLLKVTEFVNLPEVGLQDLAFIQFSSGTTGHPKPVAISHQNVIENVESILEQLPSEEGREHSCTSWLPLYHDMGLVGTFLSSVYKGVWLTLIRPEQFLARPILWMKALSETQSTVSVAPNFAFGLCTKRIKEAQLEGIDLSHWKVALCGAETVHPNTLNHFAEKFGAFGFNKKALTPVYGLAEGTLAVTFSNLNEEPKWKSFKKDELELSRRAVPSSDGMSLASLGRPLSNVKLEIRDKEGFLIPDGHIGEIWIKGPSVMQEYLNSPDETSETIEKEWLRTGDYGFLFDEELYLYGRKKDILILRGRNYDPSLLENRLDELSFIRKGCCVAVGHLNNEKESEELIILCESAHKIDNFEQSINEVKKIILTHHQVKVDHVLLLAAGALPRTSSGKIKRQESKKLFLNKELHAPQKVGAQKYFQETIKGLWSYGIDRIKEKHG
jgi:fatty-acyl-CoA synthase